MSRLRFPVHFIRQIVAIFVIAVALNYVWEIAQASLYAGEENWGNTWWHCFVASLGDGILVWIIFACGWTAFRRFDWYLYPSGRAYGLMLATGLFIGFGIEWVALNLLNRWAYTISMPVVPGLNVGLVPILQMLVLPPLIFFLAGRWAARK